MTTRQAWEKWWTTLAASGTLAGGLAAVGSAQEGVAPVAAPGVITGVKQGGSPNVHVVCHIPLGGFFRVMDNELEQDRPYAYVSQARDRPGFSIIDLKDPEHCRLLYNWRIENAELHQGLGGMDGKYFKLKGRYYYVQSTQFFGASPDADLGAVVADVTSLPDTSKIRIVARLRYPEATGGFHNMFAYKHSDGRVLLFTTTGTTHANIYDMEKVLAGEKNQGLIGQVPVPEMGTTSRFGSFGYHDFFVGYDPATHQDKFYGAGRGGYFIYDVTHPDTPKLITSITGVAGVEFGHTFTPTPDGKFAVTETEYQYAPLRIFDLRPGLEGKVQAITQPVGAWTADWHDLSHNHEVRWPFVFVSAYEDGLQVFNMVDPANPQTVGWYYTCQCKHQAGFGGLPQWEGTSVMQGAFGVKIRNSDGLIIISDSNTGFWAFHLDGFHGWNGPDWGMPNISAAQDWDHGPPGTTAAHTAAASH
jgi:hypothetical protein